MLETLFNKMREGVGIHELVFDENQTPVDYMATDVNASFETITGITREQAIGKAASELYGTGAAPFLDIYSRVVLSGSSENIEVFWPSAEKYFSLSVIALGDNRFATVFFDISEIKNALQQQQRSEEKYLELFNRYPVGLVLSTLADGRVISCNNYVVKMLGYSSREECIEGFSTTKHFVSPEDRKRMAETLKLNGYIDDFEVEFKDCNGKHLWVSYSARLEGEVIEGAAIIISEKKKAEQLLTESEERYRRLADASTEAIIITHNQKIIEFNNQLITMYGYTRDEILKLNLAQFVHPDDWNMVRNNMRNNVHGPYQHRGIHKNGSILHMEIRAETILINGTKHRLTVIRDITELMTMQEQLFQSEKMRAVGQLAGGIAHDFNNQLAGIVGYADILREELANNQELAHYTDNILLATKRASDLTFQLLAFARKGKYLSVTLNLHSIIGEVIGILERTIDRKITIKQHLEAQTPNIRGDPTQIQNAIMNIALNARDAMATGGELLFRTLNTELDKSFCSACTFDITPGSYVNLSVIDSGTGMDEPTVKKMFEPFFTTKSPDKGTGMGLASVYGTIKTHNGAITVKSTPGKGTAITLFFPCEHLTVQSTPENHAPQEVIHGDATILLVDDDPVVLDAAASMLERCGYTVIQSTNGKEAVSVFKEKRQHIDLVLLDIIMPGMNGKDTFHELHSIDPQVKVLLSSGYSINGEAQQILDEGAVDFIQKPFRRSELSRKIAEVLMKQPA